MRNILFLAFMLCTVSAFAAFQKKGKNKKACTTVCKYFNKKTKYNFSLNSAAISSPTKPFNGLFHPGIEIGFQKPVFNKKISSKLTYGADAGYYRQQGLQSALYFKPNLNYTFAITKKFSITPRLGAGLVIIHNQNSEFKTQTDGTYKKVGRNIPQFMGSIGVQPNYNVYNSKTYSYNVFMRYEFAAQTPFSAISSILPITMLHLGLSVQGTSK
jgi:hypothetical protein